MFQQNNSKLKQPKCQFCYVIYLITINVLGAMIIGRATPIRNSDLSSIPTIFLFAASHIIIVSWLYSNTVLFHHLLIVAGVLAQQWRN